MFPSLTVEEHLTAVAQPGPWTVQRVWELFPRLEERRSLLVIVPLCSLLVALLR